MIIDLLKSILSAIENFFAKNENTLKKTSADLFVRYPLNAIYYAIFTIASWFGYKKDETAVLKKTTMENTETVLSILEEVKESFEFLDTLEKEMKKQQFTGEQIKEIKTSVLSILPKDKTKHQELLGEIISIITNTECVDINEKMKFIHYFITQRFNDSKEEMPSPENPLGKQY